MEPVNEVDFLQDRPSRPTGGTMYFVPPSLLIEPPHRPNGGTHYVVPLDRIVPPPERPNGGGTTFSRPEESDDDD